MSTQVSALVVGESAIELEAVASSQTTYQPTVGGPGPRVAITASLQGCSVALLTALANDGLSERVRVALGAANVDLLALPRGIGAPTPLTIFASGSDDRPVVFGQPMAGLDVLPLEGPSWSQVRPRVVHISGSVLLEPGTRGPLAELVSAASTRTMTVCNLVDRTAGMMIRGRLNEYLNSLEMVVITETAVSQIYGETPADFAIHAHRRGTPLVVMALANGGLLLFWQGKPVAHEERGAPTPGRQLHDLTGLLIAGVVRDGFPSSTSQAVDLLASSVSILNTRCSTQNPL